MHEDDPVGLALLRIGRRNAREGEMEDYLATIVRANRAIQDAARGKVDVACMQALPKDLGDKLKRFPKVLVPELNRGQLCNIVRGKYLVDAKSVSKVAGVPFTTKELEVAIVELRNA